ncbi:MAG TPA: hypothetical protein VJT67_09465 [Longimicrobiaceae bacterium]|nr:hypothetical protein [Longimicrobiaceae bacterium]
MRVRFLLITLLGLAACAPAVYHGPRVEPGATAMMTGGIPRPLCVHRSDCHGGVTPTFGAGVRYGWITRQSAGPAYQLGALVPLWDPVGLELDGFVQAPSPRSWVGGAGMMASVRHLMPYAELGHLPLGGGDGWYLSAGYAHLFHDPTLAFSPDGDGGERMARPPRYWSPGAGARVNIRGVRYTVFANGSFGSYVRQTLVFNSPEAADAPAAVDSVRQRIPIRTLVLGLTWEMPFRKLGRPRFPPPRRVPPPDPRLPPPEPP